MPKVKKFTDPQLDFITHLVQKEYNKVQEMISLIERLKQFEDQKRWKKKELKMCEKLLSILRGQ